MFENSTNSKSFYGKQLLSSLYSLGYIGDSGVSPFLMPLTKKTKQNKTTTKHYLYNNTKWNSVLEQWDLPEALLRTTKAVY